MESGAVSAILVLAGGLCAIAGYVLGERRQRRKFAAATNRQTGADRPIDDGFADPTAVRGHRLN